MNNFGDARQFKVLLLGGTGTGKSTLINTIANYFLSGTLMKPKIVIPTKYFEVTEKDYERKDSECDIHDVTKSKTTKCFTYTFKDPKNSAYKFTIIDTPGLSDTNGIQQDDKNIDAIIDMAISAGSLSAIIVIANGTEPRVTPTIRNTLVRLANNLPDVLIDHNLLLILTKCSKNSASFSITAFANEIATPKEVFYMDNQAFCCDPKTWADDEDAYDELKLKWKKSNRTFDQLLKVITEMSVTSTKAFEDMKQIRNKIKSELQKVSQDITNIQLIQDSLDAAQKALQKTGDQKKSFANYTKTETITIKKMVPSEDGSKNTVCTEHVRDGTLCHEGCGLEFMGQSGNSNFNGCACMSNGVCNVCGCGPLSHYHDNGKMVDETKTIEKVLEDMKAQYDNADQQHKKISADADNYKSTLKNLQSAADANYKRIHQLCYDLSKVCSRFNFVDELHANIENMRHDAKAIQNADIRKNAENEIKKLIKLANDLSGKK